MFFKYIRNSKRIVASFLLVNFFSELIYPLKGYSVNNNSMSSSGGTPVSASVSGMVDGYTGDFRYSVPLVNVPGPNGENVPVSVSYKAGIGVNQKASWVGLGWDYNPGEISRQVVGAPDDYNGKLIVENDFKIAKYGALYNNNLNNNPNLSTNIYPTKAADTKAVYKTLTSDDRCEMITYMINPNYTPSYEICSQEGELNPDANANYRFKRMTAPHVSLAYDQYFVNGGISGQIKPYYLGQINVYNSKYAPSQTGFSVNARKAQFYFENSTTNSINISDVSTNQGYKNPSLVNQITNQIHSGTRVRYFTNDEINTNANLYNNANNVGFLEYKATTSTGVNTARRTEDGSLIGAFQITDPSGVTYHYSLPVYSFDDLSWNFNQSTNSTPYFNMIRDKHANSWKLTAITGPDYQDVNGNFTADEGDSGYWIAYNYSLWTNDYFNAPQRFGYKTDYSIAQKFVSFVNGGAFGNRYSRLISGTSGHVETYYLNYIQTSTHTAFFIKSIRKDEQSFRTFNIINNLSKPLLKLDKIVLLKNEDKALLINNVMLSGTDLDSRFDYSGCNNSDPNFVNITRYKAKKSDIDFLALKTIEFETNYALAKKYAGNINNSFSNTIVPFYMYILENSYGTHVPAYSQTYSGSSDPLNSGKLTLKKINFYDLRGKKITPSIDFGYDEDNTAKNPDHNPNKTDLWGYYKKDYINSHYVTNISKDDVDAWSLKEINTSLGGKIKIQYESDMYHKEGFAGDPEFVSLPCPFRNSTNPNLASQCSYSKVSVNSPHLIFPIKHFTDNYSSAVIEFEDADFGPYAANVNPLCPVPSNYFSVSHSIYNYINTCSKEYGYNNSNNTYNEYSQQLIRKGNRSPSSYSCPNTTTPPTSYPSTYNVTLNYNESFEEFDNITPRCSTIAGTFNSGKSNGFGVDYHILFRSYLYGGGVRVKQIDVVDPFKDDVYSQKFSYGEGYCPVVPKPMTLSASNGPSPYDLDMNTKPLISSSLNAMVGYDNMTQVSVNQNGENNGSVVQTYYNNLINNPVDIVGKTLSKSLVNVVSQNPQYAGGCNIGYYAKTNDVISFYNITINLNINNKESCLLGKLLKSTVLNTNGQEVTKTEYRYSNAKYNYERYNTGITHTDNFTLNKIVNVPINHQNYSNTCKQTRFTVNAKDQYYYNFSDTYTYNAFLLGTTTTKDGISISETIVGRDSYTGAPTKVVVNDPTQGTFDTYTTYAYGNTSSYPTFGLKTINENNRNLLSLSEKVRTIKNQRYVINESYVTYSNSYPTRLYDAGSGKYVTSTLTHLWCANAG